MEKQILPCPFCGGKGYVNQRWWSKRGIWLKFVRCDMCGSQGKAFAEYGGLEDDSAIDAWNMRFNTHDIAESRRKEEK